MNWEDLRHFLALAETGSLSEAARVLGVDHTTVARRVAALETALSLRLIDRLPRAVMLTAEGQAIARLGKPMQEASLALQRAASGVADTLAGPVRVSAPPAFATLVLAPHIATLKARHPGIIVDLGSDQRTADLDHREADIAVRLSRPTADGLIARKVGEIPFALYAARGYDKPPAEWTFITHDGFPTVLPQQRWLDQIIGDRPVAFRTNDVITMAIAARAGLGVAVLPYFVGEDDPGLIRLPSPEPPPVRDIWLVVHDDLRRAPRVRAVMEFLIETIDTAEKMFHRSAS